MDPPCIFFGEVVEVGGKSGEVDVREDGGRVLIREMVKYDRKGGRGRK